MSSSFNSRIPSVYQETLSRNRLPSITPSTFSIDESSVDYIDSDGELSYTHLTPKSHQSWKKEGPQESNNNERDKHQDKKQHGKVLKSFKKMLDKFMYVNVPTTDINHNNGNGDEKSAYITWLVGL